MKIKVAAAPQKNVPVQPRSHSRADFIEIRNSGASVVGLTECWALRTRLALTNQFRRKGWRVFSPKGSAVIAWDATVWNLLSKRVIIGHGAIPRTSDARNIPVVQLEHREHGYVINFYAVHPCPIPTIKAPDQVDEAKAAQLQFYNHLRDDLNKTAVPAVLMGDWNSTNQPLGVMFANPRMTHRINNEADPITQVVLFDGKHSKWTKPTAKSQTHRAQPYSDHILLIVEGEIHEA